MAKITTYENDLTVSLADKLLGSDSQTNRTKNFPLENVVAFLNDAGLLDVFDGVLYKYSAIDPSNTDPQGIINITGTSTNATNFSAITQLIVSDKGKDSIDYTPYFSGLTNYRIKLSQTDNKNNYGIFKITAQEDYTDDNYRKLTLTHQSGNGQLTPNKNYFISIFQASIDSDLSARSVTEFGDVTSEGSGAIITAAERTIVNNALLHSDVVNNVTSTSTDLPLSANQGKVLKGQIDAINTLLTSDNVDLDSLQEVVDYIEANRSTLDNLAISNISGLQTALDGKVDKVSGKGLSTNDFTDAFETKLTGIATGAEVNVQSNWTQTDASSDDFIANKPSDLTDLSTHSVEETNDVFDAGSGYIITDAERTKLTGVSTGAEANVQSDWTETDTNADSYIDNKPGIVDTNAAQSLTTGQKTQALSNLGITSTPAELNILDGVTSTAAELNILDGVTATTAELNTLDGITATTTELNHTDGVTSNIQTQIDAKEDNITGAATTITSSDLTASKALVSNASGKVAASSVTDTELGYVSGVTSSVQTQIDSKEDTITGAATTITGADLTASKALVSDSSGKVSASAVSSIELGYLTGVTSGIQAQIDAISSVESSGSIIVGVKNVSGGSLAIGTVVHISPSANPPSGNVLEVIAADNSSAATMPAIGVLKTTLANDAEGDAVAFGNLSGIDTSSFTAGDSIYVNTSGGFTTTKPTGTALIQKIGVVVKSHASNGTIKVFGANRSNDVPNIPENQIWLGNSSGVATPTDHLLNNVKDVTTSSPTDGQVLTWDNANSYWKNADASGGGGGDISGAVTIEKNVYTGDGTDVTFNTSSTITTENNVQVYLNGVYQSKDNYTTSGSTVTFSTAPPSGVSVELIHFVAITGHTTSDSFTGNGTTTAFALSQTIDDENNTQVYIDGVYQSKDNYSTSGSTITFSTAPGNGTDIEVVHIKAVDVSAMSSDSFTGNGTKTAFDLTNAPSSEAKTLVFIQGVYQEKSTYSISGSTLTFTTAPPDGYTIEITTYNKISIADNTVNIERFTGDGSDTDFTLTNAPSSANNLDVYVSGLYQEKNTYTLTGSTLTLTEAPVNGAVVECRSVANITQVVAADNDFVKFDWITTPKTAAFTAVANRGYFVNTTSAAITVTLPSSPSAGDEVSIVDYAGTADTNNITITSSNNINGASDDVLINYERGAVSIVYVDSTQGWIAYNAANETDEALRSPIITFDTDYLVVAGGASGGAAGNQNRSGGGGGAGGYRTSYGDASVSALSLSTGTDYTITVGNGAAGGGSSSTSYYTGVDGGNSSISGTGITTISSTGGGGGGSPTAGRSGGSGGGGCHGGSAGGSGNAGGYTPSEGNNGGTGNGESPYNGAGGGGASAVGQNSTASASGNGGAGSSNSITGTSTTYAGGGGGGGGYSSTGGSGGGGNGGTTLGSNGTANTGGGGGGADVTSGSGGSGVIILRYPNTRTLTETTSPSVLTFTTATDGSDKVTTFTAGANGTIQFS